jgi:hypothetical protein
MLGVNPGWSHSRRWGYVPSTVVGALAVVLAFLLVAGKI